jgi:hypothetical protein
VDVKDPAESARMELWIGSVERYHERAEAEMRERWRSYHQHMHTLHSRLAAEHAREAEQLCCENGDES